MSESSTNTDDLLNASEERLRHEIKFLRDHVANLEVFKKLFFVLQAELVTERSKIAELTRQIHGLAPEKIAVKPSADVVEEQIHQLETDLHNTQDMASLAMTTMNEYGLVIDFFKESVTAVNYQDLTMLLFMAISGYGLTATVLIRSVHGELIFTQNEAMKDQDVALIKRLKTQGRIVEHEDVVVINFTNIGLLARNFPDDREKAGRIKNYLTTLCFGVNGRVDAIDANSRLKKERQSLFNIVNGASKALAAIKQSLNEHVHQTDDMCKQVTQSMNEAFVKLGMPEKQRQILGGLLQSGNKRLDVILAETLALDEKFVELLVQLEHTYAISQQAEHKPVITTPPDSTAKK